MPPPPPPPRALRAARSFSFGDAGTEEPRGEKARRRRTGAERARVGAWELAPAEKFRGRRRLPKLLWAAGARGRGCGRRERVVRRLCATPLGQAWESDRPAPHLLKAPGAASPPPPPHVSRPLPRPRAPPRPPPALSGWLGRTSRGEGRTRPRSPRPAPVSHPGGQGEARAGERDGVRCRGPLSPRLFCKRRQSPGEGTSRPAV